MSSSIIIIDDEIGLCQSLAELLESSGYLCHFSTNPEKALPLIKNFKADLLITDVRMPLMGGIDLLKLVKEEFPDLPVIMVTGYPSVEGAVTAMRYGASNFFRKPIPFNDMLSEIEGLLNSKKRKRLSREDKETITLTSRNKEMEDMLNTVKKVAPTKAPVIITGESGTGKERIANALHYESNRAEGPYIKVNCAAIPDTLLESELFGYEKGAFTDARERHKGKFEVAHGGTIFLDEIGDMNLKTQAKILRVLQEQEFQRLGGHKVIKSDIRFVAATNKNIPALIQAGEFREDLYYRLSVIGIHLPPLRNRKEDIPQLVEQFISDFNTLYEKNIAGITPEAETILNTHSWPGNIRELKNCLERAMIFCEASFISVDHLPQQYKELHESGLETRYDQAKNELDKTLILNALIESGGIKQKAAEKLNMHRKTLYNKMKKFGIE